MLEYITIFASGLLAVVTSVLTVRLTYHSDVKREIRETRQQIYISLYAKVERLIDFPNLFFDAENLTDLVEMKPKLKLFATKDVFEQYVSIGNLCSDCIYKYSNFRKENDPQQTMVHEELSEVPCDDFPDEYHEELTEVSDWRESDLENFSIRCDEYIKENAPPKSMVVDLIDKLCESMRKDLGSSKTRGLFKSLRK